MWFPWQHLFNSNIDQSGLRARSGLSLDCEGTDPFCGLSRPSGVSVWLLNLSWSHVLAKKKRASGQNAIRENVPQETTHTFIYGLFLPASPIKSDFAFSHYWGERDKDLCLICKSSSSHPNCYYPCKKKTPFTALKPFSYLLSLCGLHLPIFLFRFYIA